MEKSVVKSKQRDLTAEDEAYLAARRVRSQHDWFMREYVKPARREN
jgi:hypothetical protein